jgi:hypothetical protein
MHYFPKHKAAQTALAMPTFKSQLEETLPLFLFHYTSPEGLLGIVQSGNIWMSDSSCMNDEKEIGFFRDAVQIETDRLLNSATVRGMDVEVEILKAIHGVVDAQVGSVYIASFSENQDQLSQWRAYGGISGGYALGLRSTSLKGVSDGAGAFLAKCTYDERLARRAAQELLLSFISEYAEGISLVVDSQSIAYEFSRTMHVVAPIFKHPSFAEEAEWRIFLYSHWQDSRLEYRASGGHIIPYIPLGIQSLSAAYGDPSPENFFLMPGPGVRYLATAGQGIFFRYLNSKIMIGSSSSSYRSK